MSIFEEYGAFNDLPVNISTVYIFCSFQISLADIVLYSTIDFLTLKDQVAKFPKIAANAKKVEADKNIAKYLKERPVTSR